MKILYLGRAPRTKETLPDFREKCRVTRHSRAFRGLTGSQRTPGFWGVTSSAEAEFRGKAHGVCELLWIRNILRDLGIEYATLMNLYCDNKAAIQIAQNPV